MATAVRQHSPEVREAIQSQEELTTIPFMEGLIGIHFEEVVARIRSTVERIETSYMVAMGTIRLMATAALTSFLGREAETRSAVPTAMTTYMANGLWWMGSSQK